MKRYLGVDLHRTQFTVCTRLENGRTYLRQWPLPELKLFAAQLRKEDEVAVESTGNTRLFHDAVVGHVAHVAVVNPLTAVAREGRPVKFTGIVSIVRSKCVPVSSAESSGAS